MPYVIETYSHWPITIADATPTSAGVMSAADKAKLDSLVPGGGTTLAQTYLNGANPADSTMVVDNVRGPVTIDASLIVAGPGGEGLVLVKDNVAGAANVPILNLQNTTSPILNSSEYSPSLLLEGRSNVAGTEKLVGFYLQDQPVGGDGSGAGGARGTFIVGYQQGNVGGPYSSGALLSLDSANPGVLTLGGVPVDVNGAALNDVLTFDGSKFAPAPGGGGGGVASVTASAPLASSGGANPDISLGASGVVPASYTNASVTVDVYGRVTAASSGVAGANRNLSNLLSPTAINQDLLVDIPGGRSLGSYGNNWFYVYSYAFTSTGSDASLLSQGSAFGPDSTGRNVFVQADSNGLNANVNGGYILINTSDATGTGNSGNITLRTGSVVSGDRGNLQIYADECELWLDSALTLNGAPGAAGQVLTSQGAGLPPVWAAGGGGGGVASVTASAPLASSGGANPDISITAGSAPGDVLAWNGAAWASTAPAGTIGGSIAANEVAFGTAPNTIGGDSRFTFNPGTGIFAVDDVGGVFFNVDPASGEVNVDSGVGLKTRLQPNNILLTNGTDDFFVETVAGVGTINALGAAGGALNLSLNELQINAAPGAAGEVLTSQGAGLPPVWSAPAAAPVLTIGEIPGGLVNGANTVFTTTANFTANTTMVYVNGLRQLRGVGNDYTETGPNQITFAVAPLAGFQLQLDYYPV